MKDIIEQAKDLISERMQIVDYTAKCYTDLNRATDSFSRLCQYMTKDGRRCAIGRLLSPELAEHIETTASGSVCSRSVWELLPANVRKLGQPFLGQLQRLHDRAENWCATGLSEQGQLEAMSLMARFSNVDEAVVDIWRWGGDNANKDGEL